jgi:hypothetical protein
MDESPAVFRFLVEHITPLILSTVFVLAVPGCDATPRASAPSAITQQQAVTARKRSWQSR